ncbi:hypothetical protein APF79_07870 [bacterium BRH_c32]|nr:MAG: hypothetical protein APF79_07870 [bacterium BRH_c32]
MQKIIPHLWFDKEAKEAADFYTSIFPNTKINYTIMLNNTPGGDAEIVGFEVFDYRIDAISAGPMFKLNPSNSFMINFDPKQIENAEEKLREIWKKLSENGKALMPLDEYPFSKLYGWIEDNYGVSWQLILSNPDGEERPIIIPSFLFVQENYGKAEEASEYYISVFNDSKRGTISRYPAGTEPDIEGTINYTDFKLAGQWFASMDSNYNHEFKFNEAFSFIVNCESQEEIDYYWEKLSAVPDSDQCGWVKDKFNVSWQIVPTVLNDMMLNATPEQMTSLTQAVLGMKKLNIKELEKAYNI